MLIWLERFPATEGQMYATSESHCGLTSALHGLSELIVRLLQLALHPRQTVRLLRLCLGHGQRVDEEVDLLRLADEVDDEFAAVRCEREDELQDGATVRSTDRQRAP